MMIEAGKRRAIVFCGNSLWALVNFRGEVIEALVRDGHRVVLVAHPDAPIEQVAALGAEFVEWKIAPRGANPWREAMAILSLWRIYRRLRPRLAFQFTVKPVIYGAVAAWLTGTRCVSVITGLGYLFLADAWRLRLAKALYRPALRQSHQAWFLNSDDCEFFASAGLTCGVAVRTLPGEGVDLARFARQPLPAPSEGFVFLMIARLVKDKGVLEYGEAARRVKGSHPQATFRLLGPLYAANAMSVSLATVQEWSDAGWVEYLGAADDVRPAIAACHCVVLPSYREGMPRVLMEAAAMARPAIASDVAGCRDVVVAGRTGLLCKPRSADSLAEACLRLLEQPRADTERMADEAHRLAADRFDVRVLIEIYRRTIEDAGAP
ncbi:MAG: glycosyltransferase family 4 protein [Caldimonas sp.]